MPSRNIVIDLTTEPRMVIDAPEQILAHVLHKIEERRVRDLAALADDGGKVYVVQDGEAAGARLRSVAGGIATVTLKSNGATAKVPLHAIRTRQ